jgi:hypothetical protein
MRILWQPSTDAGIPVRKSVAFGSDVSGGVLSGWVIVLERCEWGSVK